MTSNDLLSIFRGEVAEHLEVLNNALLQVEMLAEDDPAYHATIVEMNRISHSMKGAARAVGITVIETLSHYMEEVFSAAMTSSLSLAPEIADTIYDSLDLIQNVMEGVDVDEDTLQLVLNRLEGFVPSAEIKRDSQQVTTVKAVVETEPIPPEPETTETRSNNNKGDPLEELDKYATTMRPSIQAQTLALHPVEETVRVPVSKLDKLMAEATELIVARLRGEERQHTVRQLRRIHTRWQRDWRNVRAAYIRLVRRMQENQSQAASELSLIFKFLELNQRYLYDTNRRLALLGQVVAQDNLHLTTLAEQLQDDIGKMRLIPFETLIGGYQRMVRDLSRDLNKQIQFEVEGAFVEIDKTVLDALKDPIMHVVRNAVDHGIEGAEERESLGKSPVGRITLHVEQRGSEIVIIVNDDGSGIDPNRVRRSIVKNGIMSEHDASELSDDEARFFIFHTGLSTNDTVSAISGRGMGMDIVRERVESLRGRVGLESKRGIGTTFTLNIPVSLTRIRCILLTIGTQEYAIPSAVVTRMRTIPKALIFTAEGRDMIVIDDQPVPLVNLGAVLNIPSTSERGNLIQVVVLKGANRTVAFEVEHLASEQELVLKPLGPELARAHFVSGAALLANGEVIIVLDSNDLVRAASGTMLPRHTPAIIPQVLAQRRMRVLIVDDSITTRTLEKNILETAGFDVQVAIDGTEAWTMLGEMDFDVIISDVEMPKMTGLELTRRIKQSSSFHHIPVVLLTSLGKPEQREAGMHAGADAYLVKSQFEQDELLATIKTVI